MSVTVSSTTSRDTLAGLDPAPPSAGPAETGSKAGVEKARARKARLEKGGAGAAGGAARRLRIQTGVVARLGKEISSYRREAEQQLDWQARMAARGEEEYSVKKMGLVVQVNCRNAALSNPNFYSRTGDCTKTVQESLMMIPHCERLLVAARAELALLVESGKEQLGGQEESEAGKLWQRAVEQLNTADQVLLSVRREERQNTGKTTADIPFPFPKLENESKPCNQVV